MKMKLQQIEDLIVSIKFLQFVLIILTKLLNYIEIIFLNKIMLYD